MNRDLMDLLWIIVGVGVCVLIVWCVKGQKPTPSIEQDDSDTPATRARFLYDDAQQPVAWVHPHLRRCIDWATKDDARNGRPIDFALPSDEASESFDVTRNWYAEGKVMTMRRITVRAMVWKHRHFPDAWTGQISKEDLAHYLRAYPKCRLLP